MSFGVQYRVYICDKSYTKLCQVQPSFLQYSQVLKSVTQAYFTVLIQDPTLNAITFDPIANSYCVIIERQGSEVFRGEIDLITTPSNSTPYGIDNEKAYNTLDTIGFNASGQEQRLSDIIVNPNSDSTVYARSFADGTSLGTAITTLLNEAIAKSQSPVTNMTVGTIETPLDKSGTAITLTTTQQLYAYSTLQWIQVLSDIGNADWYRSGQTMNFVRRKGRDRSDSVVLKLNNKPDTDFAGITLNIDRTKMANSVVVVGAQDGINQIIKNAKNDTSISRFGLREQVIPIRVLDTSTTAQQYADSRVAILSQAVPLDGIQVYPAQPHTPFGNFDLGDTITIDVSINFINFRRQARVMGAVISVNDRGLERIYYSLQEPNA